MTLHVSRCAIENYRQRWRPDLSFQDAGVELRTLAEMAKPVREKSPFGQEIYAVGNVKLVVTRKTNDRRPLVVTVLPHFDPVDVIAEMVAFQEERLMEAANEEPPPSTRRTSTACPTEEDIDAAEDAYRRAGRDMFYAEALIADGKKMLADAEQRRTLAKRVLKPVSGGGGK